MAEVGLMRRRTEADDEDEGAAEVSAGSSTCVVASERPRTLSKGDSAKSGSAAGVVGIEENGGRRVLS